MRAGGRLSRRQLGRNLAVGGVALLTGCSRLPLLAPTALVSGVGLLWLSPLGPGNPLTQAFQEGLAALGYQLDQTIHLEPRSAEGQPARLASLAAESVAVPADL